jgi:uncharacterized Zn finger protein
MSASGELNKLLTRLKLRQLAGGRSFELGVEYYATGHVLSVVESSGKLSGVVQGAADYQVSLFAEGGALVSDCTCPMGAEGAFCKHCVAVGLAWIIHGADMPKKKGASPEKPIDDARGWLAKQDKNRLIQIILDQATWDTRFRERLFKEKKNEE